MTHNYNYYHSSGSVERSLHLNWSLYFLLAHSPPLNTRLMQASHRTTAANRFVLPGSVLLNISRYRDEFAECVHCVWVASRNLSTSRQKLKHIHLKWFDCTRKYISCGMFFSACHTEIRKYLILNVLLCSPPGHPVVGWRRKWSADV